MKNNIKDLENMRNIIVRMPNWLGDCVMSLPVLEDLHHHKADLEITALCASGVAPLLYNNPCVSNIITFSRPRGLKQRWQVGKEVVGKLRNKHYDMGVLLPNSFSSAWWFWRGNIARRLGYADKIRSFLLTDPVSFPEERKNQHLVITYKMLLSHLGIPLTDTSPHLNVTEEELRHGYALLSKFGITSEHKIIGINSSAAYGPAKCWLPERFCALTERLLNDDMVRVIYFGDGSSVKLIDEIIDGLPEDKVISFAGKTSLREFIALTKLCKVFVTNDSGPMHIAAALKTPLVALFGSTSDVATGPYQWGEVIHKRVSCSPCFKRVCPTDFKCMKAITIDEVYQTVLKLGL